MIRRSTFTVWNVIEEKLPLLTSEARKLLAELDSE